MSDPEQFYLGLKDLVENDATFTSDIQTLLGKPLASVLSGNQPTKQIGAQHLPAALFEQGDGETAPLSEDDDESLTIGITAAGFASDLHVALIWNEKDREEAFKQRTKLPQIFAQLMLRNPGVGGVSIATLEEWEPDRGGMHPRHVWRARIRAVYEIQKT